MSRALYTAATGMHAQQLKIDVIANNLSNVNTDGFKRSRAEFQDLVYQNLRTAGSATGMDLTAPVGTQVGLGVRPAATARNFELGGLKSTGNQLDLAIEGRGMFQVRLPSEEVVYTRNGALKLDAQGRLVTNDGDPVEPSIVVPRGADQIVVAKDGLVTAKMGDGGSDVELGRLTLVDAVDQGSFEALGGNLYRYAGSEDGLRFGHPGAEGFGNVAQGFLEGSNVKVVEEMINMISGQRAYEANSKVIQTADAMMEETNRLR